MSETTPALQRAALGRAMAEVLATSAVLRQRLHLRNGEGCRPIVLALGTDRLIDVFETIRRGNGEAHVIVHLSDIDEPIRIVTVRHAITDAGELMSGHLPFTSSTTFDDMLPMFEPNTEFTLSEVNIEIMIDEELGELLDAQALAS